jgi:NAD(P)-dependent dehydrogenase (short-subunit alcohol dehydrogenase family)
MTTQRLQGRVALVTGAQQGIGRAAALALGREGAAVVVNYLTDKVAAEAIVKEIQDGAGRAAAVYGDVSRAADIAQMLNATDAFGGIDILVNNAGIFPRVAFLEMKESDWDAVLGVNLKGTFLCSQAAAQQMIKHGKAGAIVNLASVAAMRSSPRGSHYVASKAGIIGLSRASALELAEHGIRVNAIAPGLTDTAQPRDGMNEAQIAEVAADIPLGGITTPDDIADTIVFLASREARQITGQTISVNGGQYLY